MYQLTYDSKILFDPYMQSTAITDAKYTGKSNSVSYLILQLLPIIHYIIPSKKTKD